MRKQKGGGRSKTWFTADLHIGHSNIIRYCNRPWQDVQQMNEALVANYNSVVKPNDEVYFIGDICMGGQESIKYLKRMNGRKFLVAGNHDKKHRTYKDFQDCFEWIKDYHELKIFDEQTGKRQKLILCHYAFLVWNGSHHGSWNIHGHSHGNLPYDSHALRMDVGVDANSYYPVDYSQVKGYMSQKTFKPIDHHNSRTNP